jgi:tetratricopeptide (TPR) repeat protein
MLDTTLSLLEIAELVRRLQDADRSYLFKHALVQDTAYTSLLKHERKRLHRLIGETLERAYPNALDENAALLTEHFGHAGDDAKILEYGTNAGDSAARIFAIAEAIKYYRRALDAAVRMDCGRETVVVLVTKLGRMYELRNENERALETYAILSDLARTRHDLAYELAGLMLEATLRATPTSVFDPQVGQLVLDRALQLARDLDDEEAQAKILWNLLLLNGFMGSYRAAVEYGEQALALARKLNLETQIALVLKDLGTYGYFASGEKEKTRAAMSRARDMWRELDNPPMLGDNLNNSALLEYAWGDYTQAHRFAEESLEISERIENAWGKSIAHTVRGWVAYEKGEYGTALVEMEAGYAFARETGSGLQLIAGSQLALFYAELGQVEAGRQVIQVAAGEIRIRFYRTPSKSALAYLTWLSGEVELANSLLEQGRPDAPDEAQVSPLPSIVAEGAMGLAQGRAREVSLFMQTMSERLRAAGLRSIVADAELYRGRALAVLGETDEARAAFERAQESALEIQSRRALVPIYTHWSNLERAQNNVQRADALQEQAEALKQSIAGTLPAQYRAAYLKG